MGKGRVGLACFGQTYDQIVESRKKIIREHAPDLLFSFEKHCGPKSMFVEHRKNQLNFSKLDRLNST